MDSEDNIKPFIARRFILPFIVSFFVNILLICNELNTGFENIFNGDNNLTCLVFILTQIVNSSIIALVVFAIGSYNLYIGYIRYNRLQSHSETSYFIFILSFVTSFVVFYYFVKSSFQSISTKSLSAQISTDSRLQFQCTLFLLSHIGLFVLYRLNSYFENK